MVQEKLPTLRSIQNSSLQDQCTVVNRAITLRASPIRVKFVSAH